MDNVVNAVVTVPDCACTVICVVTGPLLVVVVVEAGVDVLPTFAQELIVTPISTMARTASPRDNSGVRCSSSIEVPIHASTSRKRIAKKVPVAISPGPVGKRNFGVPPGTAAGLDVTETVNVDCMVVPFKLIVEGLKEQPIPATSPPQLRFTVPLAPYEGLIITANVEEEPTAIDAEVPGVTSAETVPTVNVAN